MLAAGLMLALSLVIRFAGHGGVDEPRFDEKFSHPPISALVREGWSVRTAIDFEETKGPGFIWPYAAAGAILGDDLPSLRWVSILAFVAGVVPLLALARRAGVHGPGLVGVALLYALLPQQALLGQLVMSEPMFVTLSLCAVWAFWWGLEPGPACSTAGASPRRIVVPGIVGPGIAGPVLVGLLLAVLLHSRIHAAALGLAFVLVAWERDRWRSWPWWLAVAIAGLSRIPLMLRWGGLVSPMFREEHQFGGGLIQWSNAAYLLAALLPLTGVFLLAGCTGQRWRHAVADRMWRRSIVGAAALVGAGIALLAPPSLASNLPAPPQLAAKAPDGLLRYLGPVASIWRAIDDAAGPTIGPALAVAVVAILAGLGAASLAALGLRAWSRGSANQPWSGDARLLGRLSALTLAAGMGMYMLAQSFVVDRYLVPWAMLLPILWWTWLPRWVTTLLGAALAVAMVGWTMRWLQ